MVPWFMDFICLRCEKVFQDQPHTKRKFCGRSCSVSHFNSLNPKRKQESAPRCCEWCSGKIEGRGKKFCSWGCSGAAKKSVNILAWLEGRDSGSEESSGDLKRHIREHLIARAGNSCSECGWSRVNPFSGSVTLTVDHVDGDARNNRPDNLKVLCYNCHTLTATFNQLNRGKGTRYVTPGQRTRKK
jgi:hypothetical protein